MKVASHWIVIICSFIWKMAFRRINKYIYWRACKTRTSNIFYDTPYNDRGDKTMQRAMSFYDPNSARLLFEKVRISEFKLSIRLLWMYGVDLARFVRNQTNTQNVLNHVNFRLFTLWHTNQYARYYFQHYFRESWMIWLKFYPIIIQFRVHHPIHSQNTVHSQQHRLM